MAISSESKGGLADHDVELTVQMQANGMRGDEPQLLLEQICTAFMNYARE